MPLFCDCGRKLGELVDGKVVVKHHRREIVASVLTVRCEDCGTVQTLMAPAATPRVAGAVI